MLHFTHTGFLAGVTYCGIPVRDRLREDDFQHPAYNADALQRQLDNPEMCPVCKNEMLDILNDETES